MENTIERLRIRRTESPILSAVDLPNFDEIEAASHALRIPFPDDYREFLLLFGGAMVGPYPVFGLRPVEVMGVEWSVIDVTQRYRKDGVPSTDEWVIFSEDHAGNPIGFSADGRVWIYDHDFGGKSELAANFEIFIRNHCLDLAS